MSRPDEKLLVLLAEVRMRLAAAGLLVAATFSAWLVMGWSTPVPEGPRTFCGGVVGAFTPRMTSEDSLRLVEVAQGMGVRTTWERGERLFKGNCAGCHTLDADMTGPAIKGVLDRAPQPAVPWLYAFLTAEDSLVRAGDAHTLATRKQFDHTASPWTHRLCGLQGQEAAELVAWIVALH